MEILKSLLEQVWFDQAGDLNLGFKFALGIGISLFCSVVVYMSYYLWILNNTPPLTVIFLSIFAFFVTLIAYNLLIGSKYLDYVAKARIQFWENNLKNDDPYLNLAFIHSYNEVKNLEIENFNDYLSPENGGNLIPISQPESKIKVAEIYYQTAVEHFKKNEKLLNLVLSPKSRQTPERIKSDMEKFLEENDTYPLNFGVDIASSDIKSILVGQTPRIVLGFKITIGILYSVFLLAILSVIAIIATKKI